MKQTNSGVTPNHVAHQQQQQQQQLLTIATVTFELAHSHVCLENACVFFAGLLPFTGTCVCMCVYCKQRTSLSPAVPVKQEVTCFFLFVFFLFPYCTNFCGSLQLRCELTAGVRDIPVRWTCGTCPGVRSGPMRKC